MTLTSPPDKMVIASPEWGVAISFHQAEIASFLILSVFTRPRRGFFDQWSFFAGGRQGGGKCLV